MKSHIVVSSLVVSGLCLALGGPLSADNISYTSPDPSKHHHYDNPAGAEAAYGAEDATGATGESWSGESSTYQGESTDNRIIKARSLIGMNVKNMQDQKLGEVRDVVVDKDSGRVNFAIMEKAEPAKGTPKNVAVHVEDFKASSDAKAVLLDVEQERIFQAH